WSWQLPVGLDLPAIADSPEFPCWSAGRSHSASRRFANLYRLGSVAGYAVVLQGIEIAMNHFGHHLRKRISRLPSQRHTRLRGISAEFIHFRRPQKRRIDLYELPVVEPDLAESQLTKIADAVHLAGANYIIVRGRLLQHAVHRPHVIGCMAPVPPRLQIAQPQRGRQPQLDPGNSAGNLARHKLKAPAGAFVIEENAAAAKHAVGFAIIHRQMKSGNLADPVRAPRMECGGLPLR